ncbi:MAG: 4Fe-4S binding protein [Deltaproteobacteria bacterium]|nr:4Fe-4S binding protein [Deltaproteobacteria bacterium]
MGGEEVAKPIDEYTWKDIPLGGVITAAGNAREYKTGDWKSRRPVVDRPKCIKCGVCWVFCPDAAINQSADGYFLPDLDHCKGCGICARECWTGCIQMVEEEK